MKKLLLLALASQLNFCVTIPITKDVGVGVDVQVQLVNLDNSSSLAK